MAEEKQNPAKKAIDEIRKKFSDKDKLKETLLEGLKSTNAKVRALAANQALKFQDHHFIKENVLPLMKSEKSKKVLRSIASHLTRKELTDRLKKISDEISKTLKKAEVPVASPDAAPAAVKEKAKAEKKEAAAE